MSKFKVGDRVASYNLTKIIGSIEQVRESSLTYQVNGIWFHEKQLRKLKKKEAPTYWVDEAILHKAQPSHVDLNLRPYQPDKNSLFNYVKVKLIRVKE